MAEETFEGFVEHMVVSAGRGVETAARVWFAAHSALYTELEFPPGLKLIEEDSEAERFALRRLIYVENNLIEMILLGRYHPGAEPDAPFEQWCQELAGKILRKRWVEIGGSHDG